MRRDPLHEVHAPHEPCAGGRVLSGAQAVGDRAHVAPLLQGRGGEDMSFSALTDGVGSETSGEGEQGSPGQVHAIAPQKGAARQQHAEETCSCFCSLPRTPVLPGELLQHHETHCQLPFPGACPCALSLAPR